MARWVILPIFMLLGTQKINSAGYLEVGGCDLVDIAKRFGTPLFVMDEAEIRLKCRDYKSAFEKRYPKSEICYASKAFVCLAMCKLVQEEGLNLDVASLGELQTAIVAEFPMKRVNLHGNNKLKEELELAVEMEIGHVVLDNETEIESLAEIANKSGKVVDVLVRCTPGVDPNTHKAISTGQADTKFGFNIGDGSAIRAIERVLAFSSLHFDGIHCHVGSQFLDEETHVSAIKTMVALLAEIHDKCGVECRILNIGGGLGVRYLESQQPPSPDEFANKLCTILTKLLDESKLSYPILQQEPGRAIVGEAGITLYTVGAIKTVPILESPGHRTYVSIDGGMSDNPRPQLYQAVYEMMVANKANQPHDEVITLAGRHCETDSLIMNARSAKVEVGDIVAVQTTGAYNYSMASNYNRFQKPAVVMVKDGNAELIVRRETVDDVLRLDLLPERFQH